MNKKTGTLLRQLAFPMLLMLLCYINLQYMHLPTYACFSSSHFS